MNWLVASLIALVCWGLWAFFIKLASKYIAWNQIFLISTIATLVAASIIFFITKPQIQITSPGFIYALLAGGCAALALVAFSSGLSLGKASIVVPLTALYPLVTILLSFLILTERISPLKGVGVLLALAAIVLLAVD